MTYEDLIEEYTVWTVAKGYPQLSADELQYELLCRADVPRDDVMWLEAFMQRWQEAE